MSGDSSLTVCSPIIRRIPFFFFFEAKEAAVSPPFPAWPCGPLPPTTEAGAPQTDTSIVARAPAFYFPQMAQTEAHCTLLVALPDRMSLPSVADLTAELESTDPARKIAALKKTIMLVLAGEESAS